jgi:methanethiol S-methyltransferase
MIRRITIFLYGVACYLAFFGTFVYAVGFTENLYVPRSIDGVPRIGFVSALLVDLALLLVFALQHSVMARQGFKRWLTRVVPQEAERSTYVLASSLALIALFAFWQPLGGIVWSVHQPAAVFTLYAMGAFGWLLVFISTFLINHFDLFGLRQVWAQLLGVPYQLIGFRTPGFYRYVRHPLYLGWFFAFWSTPTMTVTHLLFALATAGYILVAIQLEERDLVSTLGDSYRDYQQRVPMLVPFSRVSPQQRASTSA